VGGAIALLPPQSDSAHKGSVPTGALTRSPRKATEGESAHRRDTARVSVDKDPWEAARDRTREEVRAVFAEREVPEVTRTCAFCGQEGTTRWENCPHCGRSYFDKPPRLSRRARLALRGAGALALLALVAWLVPQAVDLSHHGKAQSRAARKAAVAAEIARRRSEQRPHHGQAVALAPSAKAAPGVRLRARRGLVARLEHAITADAQARIARHELTGKPPSRSACGPLVRNQTVGDEEDLTKQIGRYSCVAVVSDARQRGKRVGLFGIPFVAAVDFKRFTYVWCKDNPAASASDPGSGFVRLARECLAARGRAFGTGYLEP
jgi:hypothetical protein